MASARVVLVTHPPRGSRAFARLLVARRLAACVNLVPLSSVYRWRGKVEGAREVLLVIKTTAGRVRALEHCVRDEHPFECPEFVVLVPRQVSSGYLRWLGEETRVGSG